MGADGQRHRPAVIHRALFGSVERFFGILVEHYAGAFPTWLAPVQVRVLGVRADHQPAVEALVERLRAAGFRADTVGADEPLGARIRRAKLEKLPYVLVVGDDDIVAAVGDDDIVAAVGDDDIITGDAAEGTAATVGVNPRGGDVERGVTVADLLARLDAEVAPYRVIGA